MSETRAKSTVFHFALLLGFLLGTDLRAAPAASWGPWKTSGNAALSSESSSGKKVVAWAFRLYQKNFSQSDGAHCPFYPTCSAFAFQALSRHGLIYGSLLTVDRLLGEYPGIAKSNLYPLITKYGYHRPYDPVPQ